MKVVEESQSFPLSAGYAGLPEYLRKQRSAYVAAMGIGNAYL